MSERALVVDDDPLSLDFLAAGLRSLGLTVETARDGDEAVSVLSRDGGSGDGDGEFDYVFTDLKMPGRDGVAVLEEAKTRDPDRPVVLVTAHGTKGVAIDVLRGGADDLLEKPVGIEELELTLLRVRERARLRRENRWFRGRALGDDMVVASAAMERVLEVVSRVAASEASVLIRGESGTGKELVAAALHRQSDRSNGPFVKVNCAALPETLMESELFGHERGAFTGAASRRRGCFELAHGGTLFLDEVGETSAAVQAKLLRVLQEGELVRLGGEGVVHVDVRVVTATNRDLEAAIADGGFREDLFYRLNVVPIDVPPLRSRPEDVLPLARRFAGRTRFTADAEARLTGYGWPGNVRELQNVVRRAALLCTGGVIDGELLRAWIGPIVPAPTAATEPPPGAPLAPGRTLKDVEGELIRSTLDHCGGNRTQAARMLGIGVRTLFNKLRGEPAPH